MWHVTPRDIHNINILHADIKPGNFLLVAGELKLIDFGLAMELVPGQEYVQKKYLLGTKDYMSPEVMQNGGDIVWTIWHREREVAKNRNCRCMPGMSLRTERSTERPHPRARGWSTLRRLTSGLLASSSIRLFTQTCRSQMCQVTSSVLGTF